MTGLAKHHVDVLLDGFRTLPVNPADAFFLYRLLLGRNPDPAIDPLGLLSDPRRDRRTFDVVAIPHRAFEAGVWTAQQVAS